MSACHCLSITILLKFFGRGACITLLNVMLYAERLQNSLNYDTMVQQMPRNKQRYCLISYSFAYADVLMNYSTEF